MGGRQNARCRADRDRRSRNHRASAKVFQRALSSTETSAAPQSDSRWLAYSQWARQEIPLLRTVKEVVAFAQLRFGFESRPTGLRHRKYFQGIREKLRQEFPDADDQINAFTELQFSAPSACLTVDGRLVSSQLLNLVRFHLTAIAYTPPADTVCEIGGGYGAPARVWMTSPVRRPKQYIIIDLPELLFFAEVFLRAHFGERVIFPCQTNPRSQPVRYQTSIYGLVFSST